MARPGPLIWPDTSDCLLTAHLPGPRAAQVFFWGYAIVQTHIE